MEIPELIKALRRNMVETGSLVCLGCGHEHSCSSRGCAIMREAADSLERLNDFEHSQLALVMAENTTLKAELNRRAAPENKPLTLEQLRGMDGEPVWIAWDDIGWAKVVLIDGYPRIAAVVNHGSGYQCHLYTPYDIDGTSHAYAHKPEGSETE